MFLFSISVCLSVCLTIIILLLPYMGMEKGGEGGTGPCNSGPTACYITCYKGLCSSIRCVV